jgi:hypothetical protein
MRACDPVPNRGTSHREWPLFWPLPTGGVRRFPEAGRAVSSGAEEAEMVELGFDLADPPDEPPPGIGSEILWRVALRLYRDHDQPARWTPPRCRQCQRPWPCSSRRLAVLGLLAATGARGGADSSGATASDRPPSAG